MTSYDPMGLFRAALFLLERNAMELTKHIAYCECFYSVAKIPIYEKTLYLKFLQTEGWFSI